MNPIKFKFLPLSFIISLFGLAFSAYNVFSSSDNSCIALANCELFIDFTVLGISLWWFGIIFFFITLIFALFGLVQFGKCFSGLGVVLDIFLLSIMLISAPCSNCLIEGTLIVLVYMAFYWDSRNKKVPTKIPSPFFVFPWLIMLIMVLGDVFTSYTKPWPLTGDPNAQIRVYFSTNCSACATLIDAQGDSDNILWLPVQEEENDVFNIRYMEEQMQAGLTFKEAYQKLKTEKPSANIYDIFSFKHWNIQLQLWKNSAYVMKSNKNTIPLVEFHGLPSMLLPSVEKPQSFNNNPTQAVDDILGKVVGACGGEEEIPCPEF